MKERGEKERIRERKRIQLTPSYPVPAVIVGKVVFCLIVPDQLPRGDGETGKPCISEKALAEKAFTFHL